MEHNSAVFAMRIIVAVFCCKWAALVVRQRIAGSSYNHKETEGHL